MGGLMGSLSDIFFILSKTLTIFLFPVPLFFLVTLVFFFRLKPLKLRVAAFTAWCLFYLTATQTVSDLLMKPLESAVPHIPFSSIPEADAALVLGGMVNPFSRRDGSVEFLGTAERILLAEELLLQKKVRLIVITGGSGYLLNETEPEADILKEWLIRRGHRPDQILTENRSRNTLENAAFTYEILEQQNIKKVLFITSAFHMKRALLSFRDAPCEILPLPVDYYSSEIAPGPEGFIPGPLSLYQSTLAVKEYIGLTAYRIISLF